MIAIVTRLITAHEPPSNTTKESVLRIRTKRILNLLSQQATGLHLSMRDARTCVCHPSLGSNIAPSVHLPDLMQHMCVCVCAVAKILFFTYPFRHMFTSIQLCSSTYRRPHACMNASMQADRKPRLYVRIYVPVQISMCMCVCA